MPERKRTYKEAKMARARARNRAGHGRMTARTKKAIAHSQKRWGDGHSKWYSDRIPQ